MNYLLKDAAKTLVGCACLIILAHSLEWNGFLSMSAQSINEIKGILLKSYNWSDVQGKAISELYARQANWLWIAGTSLIFYSVLVVVMLAACLKLTPQRITSGFAAIALFVTFASNIPLFFANATLRDHPTEHHAEAQQFIEQAFENSETSDLAPTISTSWTKDYDPWPGTWSPQHSCFLLIFWLTEIGLVTVTFLPARRRGPDRRTKVDPN